MHELEQIVRLDRQVTEPVDHFRSKGFDLGKRLESVHTAIESHSE